MSTPVAAVRIEHVSHHYPREHGQALCDISLTLTTGHCFGLIGPNGAGKSTLLSLLAGLLPIQQGHIHVLGKPAGHVALKSELSLVPQDYAFYPTLTCHENLRYFAALYPLNSAQQANRIAFAIDTCQLQDSLTRRAGDCSGGVRRRLNLAIGLLNQPQLLVLDEPTAGVDAQSRHFILNTIRQLQQSGITVVYTSHYMEEIEYICQDIAILDHGQLRSSGTLDALLACANNTPEPVRHTAQRLEAYYLSLTQTALRE